MKIAFCILHQGRPYFKYAVEALYNQVDKIYIMYTDIPSQGFTGAKPCPDDEHDLQLDIKPFMDKVEWITGHWDYEGNHVDAVKAYAKPDDWLIRFDADEIFPPGSVDYYIKQAEETRYNMFRIPMIHFWRSFNWVCRDAQFPYRLEHYNSGEGSGWLSADEEYKILHFGYAQPTVYIEYKMQVSAHRPEWRKNWFADRWLANAKDDIHPVAYLPTPMWNAEPYDKTLLPDVLKKHPYYDLEVIE